MSLAAGVLAGIAAALVVTLLLTTADELWRRRRERRARRNREAIEALQQRQAAERRDGTDVADRVRLALAFAEREAWQWRVAEQWYAVDDEPEPPRFPRAPCPVCGRDIAYRVIDVTTHADAAPRALRHWFPHRCGEARVEEHVRGAKALPSGRRGVSLRGDGDEQG